MKFKFETLCCHFATYVKEMLHSAFNTCSKIDCYHLTTHVDMFRSVTAESLSHLIKKGVFQFKLIIIETNLAVT